MSEIADRYDPTRVEPHWYAVWEERGYFHADVDSPKKPYCIVIPPPNVTGSLHLGHALNNTLQDVLIRYKRMDGYTPPRMPGTDHAGIATQYVVERQLEKEGKTKEDLGREAFVARVWQWREESGGTIIRQLKRLGASCDWARERFTMDPGLSAAVREVFVRLWEEGLIYQGDYIVNWCPRCQTVLSDLEVEREEQDAEFVYIKYGPLTLGTVRPETKLGDTAVAVHPKDRRYRKYVGKTLEVPSVEGTVTLQVVADEAVDPKFGTGVIKVTPGHDPTDFEIGKRHDLPIRSVIGFAGKMTALAGKDAGPDRFASHKRCGGGNARARPARGGAAAPAPPAGPPRLRGGVGYRCRTVVEPLVSKQWYVRMKPLAEPAIKAVRSDKIKIIPRVWKKTYSPWMENIRDWAISRQLWWGHRIPVWYCDRDGSMHVSRTDLRECPQCGGPLRRGTHGREGRVRSGRRRFRPPGRPRPPRRGPGRGRAAAAGPRRARHVVLVRALALLHPRVARVHARARGVLSDFGAVDRLRHPVLLGGPDVDARPQVHGRRAVPPRLHPRAGPRRRGPEDVEVQGQRGRSPSRDGQVRDRRVPVHTRRPRGARPRQPPRRGGRRGA